VSPVAWVRSRQRPARPADPSSHDPDDRTETSRSRRDAAVAHTNRPMRTRPRGDDHRRAMSEPSQSPWYEIRVRGELSDTLLEAFPGLQARTENAETVLTGWLADRAALHGVLAEIEALGLELLEVRSKAE